ncbi:MAG: M20/M25/M40 family metallo-hydrolase [Bacteroidia bacterium]
MKNYFVLFTFLNFLGNAQSDSAIIRKLYDYHLTQSLTYKNEEHLATKIGGRLSGSSQAAQAVEWAKKAMYEAGADTVYLVPCMVPHWVRGDKEQAKLLSTVTKDAMKLNVCALGGSVPTPANGVSAEVIEVRSFDELKTLGKEKVRGKIVFFNVPLNANHIHTGSAYGESVKYRWGGASEAAKYGAVASLTRSMTLAYNDSPHTGSMGYDTTVKEKIPAMAISTIGAEKLSNLLKKDPKATLQLKTNCKTLAEEPSFSVVGEIRGNIKPEEIILVGGHLDSWDTGQGAHDDGTGVVQSIEILAGFKKTGMRPGRTIRAVAFMNEENGTRGAKSYAEYSKANKLKHIAAIESDAGGFTPRALGIQAGKDTVAIFQKWQDLFEPYDIKIKKGWGGADIDYLEAQGTICIGFEPDSQRYFDYHHTPDDTFDKVNKRELELGAAAINALVYLVDKYGIK